MPGARIRSFFGIAAACWLAAHIGAFVPTAGAAYLGWPSAGVAFAGLLLAGSALWPAAFAGTLLGLSSAGTPYPVWLDAFVAAQSSLGAALATREFSRRFRFDNQMLRLSAVQLLIATALAAAFVGAALVAPVVGYASGVPEAALPRFVLNWSLDLFLSILLVTPLILAWSAPIAWRAREAWHFLACMAVVAGVGWAVFMSDRSTQLVTWLVFPPLAWAALAFRVRGASTATAIVTVLAALGLMQGQTSIAVFQSGTETLVFLMRQFLAVVGVTLLVLATVADERRVIRALRESEAHYRYTIDLSPQMSWVADAGGQVTDVGRRWFEVTGVEELPNAHREVAKRRHPDDERRRLDAWKVALERGEPYDTEYRLQVADGSWRWMRSRAHPRRDADGRVMAWYGTTEDIHDRKMAQEAMRQSEIRRRIVLDNLSEAVVALSPDPDRCFANRSLLDMLGIDIAPRRVVDFAAAIELYHPSGRPMTVEENPASRVLRGERIAGLELRARVKATARELDLVVGGQAIGDEAGDIEFAILTMRNVTEAKRAQLQLRERETLLHAFFQTAGLHTAVVEMRGDSFVFVLTNRSTAQLFGQHGGVLDGVDARRAGVHERDIARWMKLFADARDDWRPTTVEFPVTTPTGRQWLLATINRVPSGPNGHPRFSVAGLDISEVRAAEETLRASEMRVRAMDDVGDIATWHWDLQGDTSVWSDGYVDVHGYEPASATPVYDKLIDTVHADDRELFKGFFREAHQSSAPVRGEYRIVRPSDGSVRWIRSEGRVIHDAAGKPLRAVGISRDVTARREAEASLERLKSELSAYRMRRGAAEPRRRAARG